MHPYLGYFVFDIVHYIIQLKKYIYTNDAVAEHRQLLNFLINEINQFSVRIKMNSLNVYVHSHHFKTGETIY